MVYLACLCLFLTGLSAVESVVDKKPLVRLYAEESSGIVQIIFWPHDLDGEPARNPESDNINVEGTGFLVGGEGYFAGLTE